MKKNIILILCSFTISLTSGYAFAQPAQNWEFSAETYYHRYKEPGVMQNKGMMYGIEGAYSYKDKIALKAEARLAFGAVDYKNSGTMNDIPDTCTELRGLAGYDFVLSDTLTIMPYLGLGYRYLNDDSSGKTTSNGARGYERESNYIYSPLGLEGKFSLGNNWRIQLTTEFDLFWWGKQFSHLSDAYAALGDISNTQKEGYGFRGSVKIAKTMEKIDLFIEPFVRYWNVDKSNNSDVTYAGVIIGYGYEPKNNTTEYGIKIGAKF